MKVDEMTVSLKTQFENNLNVLNAIEEFEQAFELTAEKYNNLLNVLHVSLNITVGKDGES